MRPLPFLALLGLSSVAGAQTFDCTVQTAQSGVDATVVVNTVLPGSLIGAYDATTNPTDTRTKPGIFGTFGSTENVACPITLTGGITNYHLLSRPAGSFALAIDTASMTASVYGYTLNFIADGPEVVPVTVRFTTDSFRTRNPSSTFIAGTVNLPVGDATVTVLRAVQVDGTAGVLQADGPNQYTFTVPIVVGFEFEAEILGNPVGSGGATPTPFILAGTVAVQPDGSAIVTSTRELAVTETQEPNQALPAQPFDLPTILPPGDTAHVLLNLTIQSVNASVNGTQTLRALGAVRPPCFADFNQDGGIDGADVEAFFVAWEAGDADADVNADGGVDGGDVETFFHAWEAGGC